LQKKAPRGEEGEFVRRQARKIEAAGMRMNTLIEDLLSLDRIRNGKLVLQTTVHAARSLIEEAGEIMRPAAGERNIHLRVVAPDPGLHVRCDRGQVIRVLLNLLGNAVKFTPEG